MDGMSQERLDAAITEWSGVAAGLGHAVAVRWEPEEPHPTNELAVQLSCTECGAWARIDVARARVNTGPIFEYRCLARKAG
jgi:hypothetical protein